MRQTRPYSAQRSAHKRRNRIAVIDPAARTASEVQEPFHQDRTHRLHRRLAAKLPTRTRSASNLPPSTAPPDQARPQPRQSTTGQMQSADVIKYLGRVARTGMDPAAATALLDDLADQALHSEFEPAACLEAPEPAEGVRASDARLDPPTVLRHRLPALVHLSVTLGGAIITRRPIHPVSPCARTRAYACS